MNPPAVSYKHHRFPPQIIARAVLLYFRFTLSCAPGAARRQVMPNVDHWSHKGLNNRAENSHVPLRKRERMMQGFRSPGGLQRFVSIFSAIRHLFVPPRSKRPALAIRAHRLNAMAEWNAATATLTEHHLHRRTATCTD